MSQLVLPNTIDTSTEIVASEHQQNYEAIRDLINGGMDSFNLSAAAAALLGLTQSGSIRRGRTFIAGEDTRTNPAYGLMSTPDRVSSLVLPTDGLFIIGYSARWKTTTNLARAALFLNSTQVVIPHYSGAAATLSPQSASISATGGTANKWNRIASSGAGLASTASDLDLNVADATTGQLVGVLGNIVTSSDAATATETPGQAGGLAVVFADAGTYDVSVQFKATAGTVHARQRKLWVMAIGF